MRWIDYTFISLCLAPGLYASWWAAPQNASHGYVADFCASSSLKMLARIFPRLNCDVFFMNIESRTKLIGKLLGILLLLKEH